ncbi:transformer-2 protein homolog beta isoform X2 [Phlebotomus argentipes]|uniref:transformer-2 protein homolog beta isoform X2 n=1 Tax=Phlebotomus argentipes TaxID=94469 RepID=UPI0028935C7B|nr:transformer-2 protein homolog beta isoform X2 [Phlebotomus argentipes]
MTSDRKSMSRSSSEGRKYNSTRRENDGYRRSQRSRSRHRSRSRSERRYRSRYSRSPSRHDRRRSHSKSPYSSRKRHIGNRDHPQQSRCLGVFGLNLITTESQINQIFSKFGEIKRIQMVTDVKTGRSRGFCFVYFNRSEDAKVAKENCSGLEVDGRRMRVDYSITQRAHTPTPGVYMGQPTGRFREQSRSHRDDDDKESRSRYLNKRSASPYRRRRYRSRSRSYSPRIRRYR